MFKFNSVLAWRPVYDTNITFAILYRDFTNNAFIEV